MYKKTPGLIRKNNIQDVKKQIASGIYSFDTIKNAENWFDEERIAWITERYSAPYLKFFENPVTVDNETGLKKS